MQTPAERASSTRSELAIVAGIALVLGCVTLVFPFGRDQGNYAYAAWVWLDGGVPYRDVFALKPPGTIGLHAIAQLVFGHHMMSIRAFDVSWQALTAVCVARLAQRMFRGRAGLFAGLAYPFLYYQNDFWNTAQTDGFINLPIVAAMLLLGSGELAQERARRVAVRTLGAGALLGFAIMLKYTAAVFAAPLALLALGTLPADRKSRARAALLFGAGCALFVLSCVLWLVAIDGWTAFVECQTNLIPGYVLKSAHGSTFFWSWAGLRTLARDAIGWPVLAAFVIGTVHLGRNARRRTASDPQQLAQLVVLAWLAGAYVTYVVQGKYFVYQYLPLLAPCALYVGFALSGIARAARMPLWAIGLVLAALVAVTPLGPRYVLVGRALAGEKLESQWRSARYHRRSSSVRDNLEIVRLLRRTTPRRSRVFQWGFDPMINFVAQRKTVSRFLYNYPIAVTWANPAWRSELLDALYRHPPEVFLVSSNDQTPNVTGTRLDSYQLLGQWSELSSFVRTRYLPELRVGRYRVYVRRGLGRSIGLRMALLTGHAPVPQ